MESHIRTVSPRKKILINPSFQKRFLANVLLVNTAICGIFYLAQSYFFWNAMKMGSNMDLPADHVFFRFIEEQQRSITWLSAGTFVAASALIVLFGLAYSHRIAGPVYRIQNYLKNRAEGVEKDPVHFREGDYFQELADSVNDYIHSQDQVAGAKGQSKKSA